jgi:hypothetical protein
LKKKVPATGEVEKYTVVELDQSTKARCLDGSNYKFWYSIGAEKNKWMINWEGGAWCRLTSTSSPTSGNIFDCAFRAVMGLGTSNNNGKNGEVRSESGLGGKFGYFSSDPKINPLYANYSKIFIKYCDGSFHQGYVEEPIKQGNQTFYFRGFKNTDETIKYALTKLGMDKATEIILSGSSAGSQAVYMWTPFLQEKLSFAKPKGIADSGMFIDEFDINKANAWSLRNDYLDIATKTNTGKIPLFEDCPWKNDQTLLYKCLLSEENVKRIRIPMFIIQSQQDKEVFKEMSGFSCFKDKKCDSTFLAKVEKHKENIMGILKPLFDRPGWGFWLRNCFEHVYQTTDAWYGEGMKVMYGNTGKSSSLKESLSKWFNNISDKENKWIDTVTWTNNQYCSYQEEQMMMMPPKTR